MFRAKFQAMKVLQVVLDYRLSIRLKHLLHDFKLVRQNPQATGFHAAVQSCLTAHGRICSDDTCGWTAGERQSAARGYGATGQRAVWRLQPPGPSAHRLWTQLAPQRDSKGQLGLGQPAGAARAGVDSVAAA